ncbi:MAG TPA: SDR family NAD(P)-dependent oxidoreductase [Streptosporangiaceae bacterium]|nr:SDR family NAD(P)-dependent oxidoreductase [Streptosporangiaceae bacterium]
MTTPRRALVTGASRGIGRAVAMALAESGYQVVGAARTAGHADGQTELRTIRCDMADLDAVRAMPAQAEDQAGGPFDVLVHCAGISRPGRATELPLDDWEESMRVNVTSALLLAQHCVPGMVERRWGRIVTIGSLYSRMGARFAGAYAASKHALLGLTRVLAIELATKGVTANCVIPGWTDTELVRNEAENVAAAQGYDANEAIRRFLRMQPLGRMVQPAEVGALVAFLCSDAAAAITGQAINIDGGSLQS